VTRAVIVLRLSKDSTSSSSIERQRAWCTEECERRGWVIVGEAEDVDVSGGVDPFHRPALGGWLRNPHTFDALVAHKMDRLTRDLGDQVLLGRWADKHGIKILAEGQEIDSMTSRMQAMVAEGELRRIAERNREAAARNLNAGNYRGGHAPFGYRPVKVGNAWRLEPDPEQAEVVRRVVERVLSGDPVTRICQDLNAEGVPTTQDAQRLRAGKGYKIDPRTGEPRPARWSVNNLIRMLSSETLLGYAMRSDRVEKNGKPVEDVARNGRKRKQYREKHVILTEDGTPVQRAEPIITADEFGRVQAALQVRRGAAPKRRVNGVALLLQVIFCMVCGRPMYAFHQNRGRPSGGRAYYRCASVVKTSVDAYCGNRSARLDAMDEFVEHSLLAVLGGYPNVRRTYVAGSDHTEQIAEIDRQLDAALMAVTRFTGSQLDNLLRRVDALNETKARLEAEPRVEPGYRYVPTSVLFRDHWKALEPADRNQWLRDHNVRMTYQLLPGESEPTIDLRFADLPALIAVTNPDVARILDRHGDDYRRFMHDEHGGTTTIGPEDGKVIVSFWAGLQSPDAPTP